MRRTDFLAKAILDAQHAMLESGKLPFCQGRETSDEARAREAVTAGIELTLRAERSGLEWDRDFAAWGASDA